MTDNSTYSPFDALVNSANPFAKQCCDCDAVALIISKWCDESGEPAIFISTEKNPLEPKRFPIAISFYRMNPENRLSVLVQSFPLTRPDYKNNEFGFQGNHLVVSLLREIQKLIRSNVRLPVETFTGQLAWSTFCDGPGYFALKEQRSFDYAVPEDKLLHLTKPRSI